MSEQHSLFQMFRCCRWILKRAPSSPQQAHPFTQSSDHIAQESNAFNSSSNSLFDRPSAFSRGPSCSASAFNALIPSPESTSQAQFPFEEALNSDPSRPFLPVRCFILVGVFKGALSMAPAAHKALIRSPTKLARIVQNLNPPLQTFLTASGATISDTLRQVRTLFSSIFLPIVVACRSTISP